jgi:hypothetical protein
MYQQANQAQRKQKNHRTFTNKHKIIATFIHVGNNQGPLETL